MRHVQEAEWAVVFFLLDYEFHEDKSLICLFSLLTPQDLDMGPPKLSVSWRIFFPRGRWMVMPVVQMGNAGERRWWTQQLETAGKIRREIRSDWIFAFESQDRVWNHLPGPWGATRQEYDLGSFFLGPGEDRPRNVGSIRLELPGQAYQAYQHLHQTPLTNIVSAPMDLTQCSSYISYLEPVFEALCLALTDIP